MSGILKLSRFVPDYIKRSTAYRVNIGTPFSIFDQEDHREPFEPRWTPPVSTSGENFVWVEEKEADFLVLDVALNWQNYLDGLYESSLLRKMRKSGRLIALIRRILSKAYRPINKRKLVLMMMKKRKPLVVVDFSDTILIPPFITKKDVLFKTSLVKYGDNIIPAPYIEKARSFASLDDVEFDISFCGWIGSHQERKRAVDSLSRCKKLKAMIIHTPKWFGRLTFEEQCLWREKFNDSIKRSILVLAPRGGAVLTERVYEAMAFGRIPVIVGNNLCLAFPDLIPWDELVFCVPDNMVDHVDKFCFKILQDNSRKDLETRARRCHEYFNRFLAPNALISSYCYYLRRHLERLLG